MTGVLKRESPSAKTDGHSAVTKINSRDLSCHSLEWFCFDRRSGLVQEGVHFSN